MARILVYDSGVGGLSVLAEISKVLSDHQLDFFSDNAGFPYGLKSEIELSQRVVKVVSVIDAKLKPDILVLACNSASTIALPILRNTHGFPIVGVVPAIKPAAERTQSGNIALLATPGTIGRQYTQTLIDDYAIDIKVHSLGSNLLVQLAEQKLAGEMICLRKIKQELEPLMRQTWDVLVLACTHFPLLRDELQQVFAQVDRKVEIVDSGRAIAKRVESLVKNIPDHSAGETKNTAYFTELDSVPLSVFQNMRGFSLVKQSQLAV